MYNPPAFVVSERADILAMIRAAPLATFVTATAEGPLATTLPLYLDADEGEHGTLYGHLARANGQWKAKLLGDALAIFAGADAYVTPSWYAAKQEHGKVVPTWNYEVVHARGPVEFFEDAERLKEVVSRLTDMHEAGRRNAWAVSDAPDAYIAAQLRGIIGLRMPITTLSAKRKMSQNRNAADRAGVRLGLMAEDNLRAQTTASLIPQGD